MIQLYFYNILFLFSLISNSGVTTRHDITRVKGNQPAILKTTNGCWDVSHLIVNRGDPEGIPGTVACFEYTPDTYNDTIFVVDTLPKPIIDAAFSGEVIGGNDTRYFIVSTEQFIYLYTSEPSFDYGAPAIVTRYDSMPTPSNYIKALYNNNNPTQALIVNMIDSVHYDYKVYSIPELTLYGEIQLAIKRDLILTDYNSYVIIGDSSGTQKLMKVNQSSLQVTQSQTLPASARNTRAYFSSVSYDYFISTPGDSVTNLIQYNVDDTAFNTISLFPASGINAVIPYSQFPAEFLLQPTTDTSVSQLNKQLLVVDAVLGQVTNSFNLGKTITSLHANAASYMMGTNVYSIVFGVESPDDEVYFFPPWTFGMLDSSKSGIHPTWFGEDFRCYVSVQQIEENLSIDAYPNPVTDELIIQASHLASGKSYKFDIINLEGKVLWEKDIVTKQEYTIPVHNLPNGVLILRIDAGTKVVTKKIIKQ